MIKVLIVDDEYIMRQGLKYMLKWEEEGYEIVGEASNGKEALELMEKCRPHIIICDIVMPVMDGVDFAEVIRTVYPDIPMIILSGYDNFEYVKRTFLSGVKDYILKPSLSPELLRKSLNKVIQQLPNAEDIKRTEGIDQKNRIERYILGHDDKLEKIEGMYQYFEHSRYRLLAIDSKRQNSKKQDLSVAIYKKMERFTKDSPVEHSVFLELKDGILGILFCFEWQEEQKLSDQIKRLSSELEMISDHSFVVISPQFYKIEDVKSVYQNKVLPNIGKKFYYENDNALFVKEEYEPKKPEKFDFVKYNFAIENKKYREALHMLTQYNENAVVCFMDEYKIKNQMKNMVYCFIDGSTVSEEKKDELQDEIFRKIEQSYSKTQFETALKESIALLEQTVLEENGKGDNRLEVILEYIENCYYEDLRLDNIAEKFNYNYSYLSAIFAQQMKEGFNDHVNRVRINKACQLLKGTNMSIAEIGQEVGYSDHSYFSRVFRKITGKTPSEWRRKVI